MVHVFAQSASKVEQILGHTRVDQDIDVERSREPFSPPPFSTRELDISEELLLWKQDVRILPLWTLVLFIYFLDRSNLTHAVLLGTGDGDDIMSETQMTTRQFKTAQTAFFLATTLFAVPSNILLKKLRPSRWLALSIFAWGVISMCMSVVADGAATAGVRFLQGVFQASILPGLPFYLTFWYRARERATRLALTLAAAVFASSFGPAIARSAADHIGQAQGIAAWRWLFIVEGLPACTLVAPLVLFGLPDFPEESRWLSNDEKEYAMRRLYVEGSKRYESAWTWDDAVDTLLDVRLYAHYLAFLGISTAFASLPLFTPAISTGRGFTGMQAQLMAVPPFVLAAVVSVATSLAADRLNARGIHSAVLATVGAVGFLASAIVPADAYGARYACLFLTTAGSFGCVPLLLAWLSNNVADTPSVGLSLGINAGLGGGLGEIIATWSYKEDEATRGTPTGHWVNAVLLLSVAAGCILLRLHYNERNHRVRMETGGHEAIRFYSY